MNELVLTLTERIFLAVCVEADLLIAALFYLYNELLEGKLQLLLALLLYVCADNIGHLSAWLLVLHFYVLRLLLFLH